MTQLCLFPIPQCVTFPGTVFPLHVFEPRYRRMIAHCLETQTPVAICHTKALLSEGKAHDSVAQALNSDQATYRPYDVVSAGQCELIERTDDGRMYLNVHIEQRYRIVRECQLLPYQVYEAEVFNDISPTDTEMQENQQLKEKIMHRLAALAADMEGVQQLLTSPEWQHKDASAFSFELFGLVRFDAELLQHILEMPSAHQRLQTTLELLNQA
ncbi:ATP-dependent protease [Bacterioplanes sanyensis]|uniref:LON peptidase substrate-binding domain-containing protein n=1 Tax=Bacterioplanes sanyensis TaxID=1249553 RepID=UPI001677CF2C|nr:LON peptidase substrate-binding domain-containing protein [Bacterioplanes sanyensis]GGY35107.1 ATP-dependent protease [Bacterioplanes sanyensis]